MTDMMRLRICLCLVVMAVMPVAATGYELHYDADGPALNDVCGLTAGNDAVFWAVGDSGKVFKIVNDSIQLEYTLGGGQYDFHGVAFKDTNHGWIVGYERSGVNRWRGVIFRTTTGGGNANQWDPSWPDVQRDDSIKVPLLKVQFAPDHYVWATCGDGNVIWSNDGYWWSVLSKPAGPDDYSYIWGLWAFNGDSAWVASDESMMIAKTTNLGYTWSTYRPFPNDSLSYRGIGPFAPTSGLDFDRMSVAGSRGKIVHTTDGGSNWSEEPYNPCQWWRGTSQNYAENGGRLCVGTCGIPGRTARYDLNDVEQIEIGYNHWDVSVGTNAAIEVDTFNTSPGILEECTLNSLDAVSTPGDSVIIYFTFTNTTDHDSLVDVYLWRSIMQEDFGGDADAHFYYVVDSSMDLYVHRDDTTTWRFINHVPSSQTFWFALTTSKGPNCSASPNVDSARASGAPYRGQPVPHPYWFTASDAAGDHGSSLCYQWDTVPHPDSIYMQYAIIRPATDTTHPYYTGHRGGLVGVAHYGDTYSEDTLVTGVQYRRGVRAFYFDRWDGAASQQFAADTATPVDNTPPPKVAGLAGRYVPQLDACEIWWDPIQERGDAAYPETYEPNLGGYWVCPEVIYDVYTINHQSPLFRNHYIQRVPDNSHGHQWAFSVCARDRTGLQGEWSDYIYPDIPDLASTSALATAYNNGTHLARVPNTATEHVVYESNDEIHYANSTDGGDEWHCRATLDTGTSPAVATNASGMPWVVYLKDNVVRYKANSSSGGIWGAGGVLFDPDDDSVIPGPPAIVLSPSATAPDSGYAFAAFPVYDLDAGTSSIVVVKFR